MIDTEAAFNGLGIDAVTGVELMDWLGLTPVDLGNPSRFSRLQQVIDYLKQFPEDTQRYLVTRATKGKMVDKLNHMWEYTQILKNKEYVQKLIDATKKEKEALGENADPFMLDGVDKKVAQFTEELGRINSELDIYEK